MHRLSRIADAVAIGLAAIGLLALLVDGTLAGALFVAAAALWMVRPVAWMCGRRAVVDPTDQAGA